MTPPQFAIPDLPPRFLPVEAVDVTPDDRDHHLVALRAWRFGERGFVLAGVMWFPQAPDDAWLLVNVGEVGPEQRDACVWLDGVPEDVADALALRSSRLSYARGIPTFCRPIDPVAS